ncbi:MAG: type II secretion system F family protein, partial [Planctomycetota bacterium]
MHFAVEAMRPDGTTLSNVVEAPDRGSAVESLRDKGLVVLRVDPHAESGPRSAGLQLRRAKITLRDLVLLTRQMKMLLESGAPLVPALEAAHEQTTKPAMRALLARLRERVEEGESLSEALVPESQHFDAVFRSMVAAGESTATLPDVFGRLGALTQRQMQTRKLVVGALLYPAVLSGLLVTVLGILLFFVVPRFKLLFNTLRTPLPATTKFLFAASEYVVTGWPYLLAAGVAASVALVLALRRPAARIWLDRLVVGLPVVGRLL